MNRITKMKLLFCVPMVVILGCYFGLLAKADDNTLYLQDIAGDRAFLKPFTVQMELYGNAFHENIFINADGVTKEPFETVETEENPWLEDVGIWKNRAVYVENGDVDITPAKDAVVTEEVYEGEYCTTLKKYDKAQADFRFWVKSTLSENSMHIKPDLVFEEEDIFEERKTKISNNKTSFETNMIKFTEKVSTKTVLIGDNLYTIICTRNMAKGNTGIYRTNMQDLCNTKTSALPTLPAVPFLEFSVDKQKSMLGLEKVGENLALFRREGTVLWLELYDTTGKLLQSQHWDTGDMIDNFEIKKADWKDGTGFHIYTYKEIDTFSYENTKEILICVERNTIQQPKIDLKYMSDVNMIYKNK